MVPTLVIAWLGLASSVAAAQSREVTVTDGFQDPTVDPDGNRIAFALYGKIWLVPTAGGDARQVTFGSGWDSHPAWSPDGRFIAYAHLRPGRAELVVHSLESGGERTLYVSADPRDSVPPPVEQGNVIGQMAWRPNTSEIVFLVETDDHSAHLWSVPLRPDGRAKQLTHGARMAEWSFAIAPDGQQAAVEWVQQGAPDLFVVTLDSGRSRRATSTTDEEFSVQWSRDGQSLVYVARDNGIDRVIVRDVATGTGRTVFESAFDGKQLSLLPDGSAAVMVAGRRLHQLDLRTGRVTRIPVRATFRLPERSPGNLLVSNVRLWDGTGAPVRDSSWVLVRDGQIARVGRGPVGPEDSAGVATIDGAGRFMLPGLMDNHYHSGHEIVFDLPRRLAMGVTTSRDVGTELAEALNFRAAVRLGVIEGPDLYTTGPLIDGPCGWHPMNDVLLDRPDAAPALVRALQAQGVDAIKLLPCLPPEVLRAVVAEARRLGLPVTAHVGNRTVWDEAVRAGVTGINHVTIYRNSEPTQARGTRGRLLQVDIPADPDRPDVDNLLARMAGTGIAMDPTLHVWAVSDARRRELGVEEGERALSRWRMDQRFVKKVVDAGVMLLAGTDNNPSLNDELEDYEAAGVPREVILQSATVNGSRWLGKEAEFGTIQPGRRGHLLLVDGDPLTHMTDLRQVVLVVKDGRVVFRRLLEVFNAPY